MHLQIIYEDEYLVAVNKPHGLLVHKTKIANEATEFALQILRDQINQKVFPVHRLDRKTAGALLFSKSREVQILMNNQFKEKLIEKTYLAIVRGYIEQQGIIDYALTNEKGKTKNAITNYKCLAQTEIDLPFGKHNTSRYSLVELKPLTGRYHQLRKHLAHIYHPIIGDRPHGCNKQNKLFKQHFNTMIMFLNAVQLKFVHPIRKKETLISAKLSKDFEMLLKQLNFNL